ncbi:ribosomal RNA large subunit methyltransferase N [Candidatus Omnitrophus magneticus]|uniref:Probable dual-specificity RNA methyltransferase RlmN n=1 Tax=Candidatus Omnitrophus magneticus TaxID=1609969 RepID=A0A0F0CV61_9BACT|nr:ribosomal RNA large subunit methyltransferase N [Candidatus Omnitrophus magneticus]
MTYQERILLFMEKKILLNYTIEELREELKKIGEPSYRANQIWKGIYQTGYSDFTEMTALPKNLIDKLNKTFIIFPISLEEHLVSKDGAEKFLWLLNDSNYVETVVIKGSKRVTICLSTQAGCKFKCPFCSSGKLGLKRNLSHAEIISQFLLAQKLSATHISNVVFMGMGEPLDNYDNLIKAIQILNNPEAVNIGARKITVSTCGIAPNIIKLSGIGIQIELSISLHSPDNSVRNELVPVNKKFSLERLIDACEQFFEKTGRVITFEYTLIKDKNDSIKDAEKLAEIAKKTKGKINLIPGNNTANMKNIIFCNLKEVESFKNILLRMGVTVTTRSSKGYDILAACGQLAGERSKKPDESL